MPNVLTVSYAQGGGIFPLQSPILLANLLMGSGNRLWWDHSWSVGRVLGETWYLLMLQMAGKQYLNQKQM